MDKQAMAQRLGDLGAGRDQLMQLINDRNLAVPLLAAGAGGLAGGVLSGRSPRKPRETRAEKRRRVLRDALLSAGVAGGATALGRYGFNQLATAIPEGVKNPAAEGLAGAARFGLGAGAGYGAHRLRRGHLESDAQVKLKDLNIKPEGKATGLHTLRSALRDPQGNKAVLALRQDPSELRHFGLHPTGNPYLGAWGLEGERLTDLAGKGKEQFKKQVLGATGAKARAQGLKSLAGKTVRHGAHFAGRHPGLATTGAVATLAQPTWKYLLSPAGKAMTPSIFTFD